MKLSASLLMWPVVVSLGFGGCGSDIGASQADGNQTTGHRDYLTSAYEDALAGGQPNEMALRVALGWVVDDKSDAAGDRFDAMQALIGECMQSRGIAYAARQRPPATAQSDLDDDRSVVAERGYGYEESEHPSVDANGEGFPGIDQMSEAELDNFTTALTGTPAEPGCEDVAEDQLFGEDYDEEVANQRGLNLQNSVWTIVQGSPHFEQHNAMWVQCMNHKGRAASDINDFLGGFLSEANERGLTGAEFSEHQVAFSLDDYDCRKESQVATVWNALNKAAEDKIIEDNQEFLASLDAQRSRANAVAATVAPEED